MSWLLFKLLPPALPNLGDLERAVTGPTLLPNEGVLVIFPDSAIDFPSISLNGKRIYFSSEFRVTVHHGRTLLAVGA